MTLSQQTLQRLPTIKAGLMKGDTTAVIGKALGVYEKTIDRDIKAFVESGEFETWIKTEWLRLHNQIIHEDPTEAYRNITKLLSRMIIQKREIKQDLTVKEEHVTTVNLTLSEYQQALDEAARLNIQSNNQKQQVDAAQTTPKTTVIPIT